MTKLLLKKTICNRRMAAVIVISAFLLYLEAIIGQSIFSIDYSGKANISLLINIFALTEYTIFAGMFPGIPYGFSFLEERNSGYLRFVLQRMPAKKYIRQKIFYTGLSGAISTMVPYVLLLISIIAVTSPATAENIGSSVVRTTVWNQIATVWGGGLVLLLKGVLLGMFGILWSEVTLLVTLFVRNRYIAFVLPFILFQLCWLLFPVNSLNPVFLIRYDFDSSASLAMPYALFAVYTIVVAVAVYLIFRKKIQNEEF